MQGVQLLLAAVVAIQRPALPPEIGLALAQAQAAFTAVALVALMTRGAGVGRLER